MRSTPDRPILKGGGRERQHGRRGSWHRQGGDQDARTMNTRQRCHYCTRTCVTLIVSCLGRPALDFHRAPPVGSRPTSPLPLTFPSVSDLNLKRVIGCVRGNIIRRILRDCFCATS
ncbi:hypothetical protein LIA77_10158 [Sarocladium implicatum]|nr:hypothetical protein LIA77_10158 [Sarocladium implicatum]